MKPCLIYETENGTTSVTMYTVLLLYTSITFNRRADVCVHMKRLAGEARCGSPVVSRKLKTYVWFRVLCLLWVIGLCFLPDDDVLAAPPCYNIDGKGCTL